MVCVFPGLSGFRVITSSWSSLVLISPELGLFMDSLSVSCPLSLWSTTYTGSGLADEWLLVSKKIKKKKKSHQLRNCVWNGPNLSLVGDRTLHQKNINDLNFICYYFKSKNCFKLVLCKTVDLNKMHILFILNVVFNHQMIFPVSLPPVPPAPAYSSTEINTKKVLKPKLADFLV